MDSSFLISLMLIGRSKQGMADILKGTLPATLSNPSQRFVMAALMTEKELKHQEEANRDVIREVVKVVGIKDRDTLESKFPTLYAVFAKLPTSVQDSIEFPAGDGRPTDGSRKS